MKYSAVSILQLLQIAATKAKLTWPLAYADFADLEMNIAEFDSKSPELSQKYLYDNLLRKAQKAEEGGQETIGASVAHVKKLVRFAGFQDWAEVVQTLQKKPSPLSAQLQSLIGNWYSYVRCNSGQPFLLKSPVRLLEEKGKLEMELSGARFTYRGEVDAKGGNLFILLRTQEIKQIHLVLEIGYSMTPQVIKGVFSGVNAAGNPIAGKEVLIRSQEPDFSQLTGARIPIEPVSLPPQTEWESLYQYFATYENSNLKTRSASTFTVEDLLR
ncbi:MAG: hypothetical protein AAF399_03095 [Bacteroidota bacterium]